MALTWLVEADVFGRSYEPFKLEMRQQGVVCEVLQPEPFFRGATLTVGGRPIDPNDCILFSGTYPVMRHIQLHTPWRPGGWCTAENFHAAAYYPHLGEHLLNAEHALLPIDEALAQADSLFQAYGQDGRVFFRPGELQKIFTGRLEDRDGFVLSLQSARYAGGSVLIARPRDVADEWRAVVSGDRVVAVSQYRQDGQPCSEPGCPADVQAYLERLLACVSFRPDPIFMLDVGRSEGELKAIELNSFSCSGLYRCDPRAVVAEVKGLAWSQFESRNS